MTQLTKTPPAARKPRTAPLNPRRASPHFSRGETHRKLGRLNFAIAEYRKAVELHPDNAFYRFKLGDCCAAAGQYDEAVEEMQVALDLLPEEGFYHFWLGDICARAPDACKRLSPPCNRLCFIRRRTLTTRSDWEWRYCRGDIPLKPQQLFSGQSISTPATPPIMRFWRTPTFNSGSSAKPCCNIGKPANSTPMTTISWSESAD